MSWAASGKAMAIRESLRPGEKLVLLALADHHNRETGRCDPSLDTLAGDAVMTRKAVIANLHALREKGLITVGSRHADSGRRLANFYTLTFLDGGTVKKLHSQGVETTQTGGVETTPDPKEQESDVLLRKTSEEEDLARDFLHELTALYLSPPAGTAHEVQAPRLYFQVFRDGDLPPFDIQLVRRGIGLISSTVRREYANRSNAEKPTLLFPPVPLLPKLEEAASALEASALRGEALRLRLRRFAGEVYEEYSPATLLTLIAQNPDVLRRVLAEEASR